MPNPTNVFATAPVGHSGPVADAIGMIADRFGGSKGLHLAPFVDKKKEPALAPKGGWTLGSVKRCVAVSISHLIGDLLVV